MPCDVLGEMFKFLSISCETFTYLTNHTQRHYFCQTLCISFFPPTPLLLPGPVISCHFQDKSLHIDLQYFSSWPFQSLSHIAANYLININLILSLPCLKPINIYMTRGHGQWCGGCLREWVEVGWREKVGNNLDNCNSINNKIFFKNQLMPSYILRIKSNHLHHA